MDAATIWLCIFAIGAGTFALRFSFIELAGRMALPESMTRALRFLPPAVLSAIIVPAVLRHGPASDLYFGIDNPRVAAAAAAALVAWLTKSVVATLAAGMATLWLIGWMIN
ncbi:MAG: AzlD domain-containing protein [Parvibaculum sp.]|jgi:branched-subunit amino acid transport protein|uniref:AzlD domain-containing protein n=1 Tax=Parvibaculum sp. TaxID=2024848 RepID=UPI003262F4A7